MAEAKATEAGKTPEKKKAKAVDTLSEKKVVKQAWTMERCQKVARRFQSESEWAAGAPASYKSAVAHGWVGQCIKGGKTLKKSA